MNGGIDRLQNGMTNMTALRKEFHSIRFAAVKLKMTALLFDCPIQPVEQPVSVCMSRQFSVVLGTYLYIRLEGDLLLTNGNEMWCLTKFSVISHYRIADVLDETFCCTGKEYTFKINLSKAIGQFFGF